MPAGVTGEKALALFNSDNFDSDGDGVSNAMERVFGGDSLGQDSRGTLPAPVKVDDGKEYITFIRYNSTYQADMGVTYIVEKSDDRRTWTTSGVSQVGSAVDLGGGMEQVVYTPTQPPRRYPVHPGTGEDQVVLLQNSSTIPWVLNKNHIDEL